MRSGHLAIFLLTLSASLCPLPAAASLKKWQAVNESDSRIFRAYEAGDRAAVLAELKRFPDPADYKLFELALWRLGLTLEQAGRPREARDYYLLLIDVHSDADAVWALERVARALGPQGPDETVRLVTKRDPPDADIVRAILEGPSNPASQLTRIDGLVRALEADPDHRTRSMLRQVHGDLLLRTGDPGRALAEYAVPWQTNLELFHVAVRQAAALAALGDPDALAARLHTIDSLHVGPGLGRPAAFALLAHTRAVSIRLATARAAGDTLAHQRAWDASPPPAGLDPVRAFAAARGVTLTLAERDSMWSCHECFEDSRISMTWHAETRSVSLAISSGWAGAGPYEDAPLGVSIALQPNDLIMHWQPEHRAFAWDLPSPEASGTRMRLILHENGDLFVGDDRFLAKGYRFSRTHEPFVGATSFGLPFNEAFVIRRELESAPIDEQTVAVRAELAGGGEFLGSAVRTPGGLVPAGYGRIVRAGEGIYVGRFDAGFPAYGVFVRGPNRFESVRFNVEASLMAGARGVSKYGFYRRTDEVDEEYYPVYRQIDLRSAYRIRFDPRTGDYSEDFAEAERDSLLEQYEAGRRDVEGAKRWEENRRIFAEAMAAEAAQDAADAEALRKSSSPAQFMAPKRSNRCIHCRGTGQIYVAPDVRQGFTYDASTKQMNDTVIHTSGHMETCTWCNGTGKR